MGEADRYGSRSSLTVAVPKILPPFRQTKIEQLRARLCEYDIARHQIPMSDAFATGFVQGIRNFNGVPENLVQRQRRVEGKDWESVILQTDPRFWKMIRSRRKQATLSLDEVRRRLKG